MMGFKYKRRFSDYYKMFFVWKDSFPGNNKKLVIFSSMYNFFPLDRKLGRLHECARRSVLSKGHEKNFCLLKCFWVTIRTFLGGPGEWSRISA